MRESSRGGVLFGVEEKNEVLLGSTILPGLDRDRLERWNDAIEKRLFFLSSLGLSVSGEKFGKGLLGTAVADVVLRVGDTMNSGSSDASREEGMESVRERAACITNHISMWTLRTTYKNNPFGRYRTT
jgi:hypothetical protein